MSTHFFALSFVVAVGAGGVITPPAIWIGRRFGWSVQPRLFGRSNRSISYLGGLALVLAAVAGLFAGIGPKPTGVLAVLLAGALCVLVLGLADDRTSSQGGLSPASRVAVEMAVSAATWMGGLRTNVAPWPWLDLLITALLLTGCANALNLVDNMDGVAGATSLAAAIGLGVSGVAAGFPPAAALGGGLAGACLVFLVFNKKRPGCYLGDSGSLSLGFLLAGGAIMLPTLHPASRLLSAIALMATPATDMLTRQLYRRSLGRSLFDIEGGVDHISHRLQAWGCSTSQVALLFGSSGLMAAGAASTIWLSGRTIPAVLLIGLFALGALRFSRAPGTKTKRLVTKARVLAASGGLALIGILAAPAIAAAAHLVGARSALLDGAVAVKTLQMDGAKESFRLALARSLSAKRSLSSKLAQAEKSIPVVGDAIKALGSIASATGLISEAAGDAGSAVEQAAGTVGSPKLLRSGGNLDVSGFPAASVLFKKAEAKARMALAVARKSPSNQVWPVGPVNRIFIDKAEKTAGALKIAGELTDLVPELMDPSRPQTWFVAIQNGAELRATGGLVGAFGIIKISNGRINLERLEADRHLPLLTNARGTSVKTGHDPFDSHHLWQNVNMSPDFPTAAAAMAQMWQTGGGERIDGVVGIDVNALANILGRTGQVEIPGLGNTATKANLAYLALNQAYAKTPNRAVRQDLLVDVGRGEWQKLIQGRGGRPPHLGSALFKSVNEKHLMAWSRNEKTQKLIDDVGAAGTLKTPGNKDHLMVVSQNASASKMDFYATRTIGYSVRVAKDGHFGRSLRISLNNQAPSTGISDYVKGPFAPLGTNRSYLSAYLGKGARVVNATLDGAPVGIESTSEKGLPVASQFIDVDAGRTGTFAMKASPGTLTKAGEYRLQVQKQPSLHPDLLVLDIALPDGAFVTTASPGAVTRGSHLLWRQPLNSDREFLVRFRTRRR